MFLSVFFSGCGIGASPVVFVSESNTLAGKTICMQGWKEYRVADLGDISIGGCMAGVLRIECGIPPHNYVIVPGGRYQSTGLQINQCSLLMKIFHMDLLRAQSFV